MLYVNVVTYINFFYNRSGSNNLIKRIQFNVFNSRYYKPLHAVSRRQQRLRLARRKQIIKKAIDMTKSLLIDDSLICPVNTLRENITYLTENIMEPQNFEECNVNYFVQERLAPVAHLPPNEKFPLCTNNVDRVDVMNKSDEAIFQENLAAVLVDANHVLGNRILTVLRTHNCFTFLPKDIRTLLFTPRIRPILHKIEPGEYLHFGVKKCLARTLEQINFSSIPEVLEIDISTDGAQLHRSGKHDIWPIQCRIANIPKSIPETIGVYKGPKKPNSSQEFFQYCNSDLHEIFEGGIIFKDRKFSIKLRCFIADAPARAFILGHKSHRSSCPCSKCTIHGFTIGRYMVLRGIQHRPRTNEDYRRQIDEEHHKCSSPLSHLPFDMVKDVVFEYMHMCCLGVMKKLILTWLRGTYTKNTKLTGSQIQIISNRLKVLSKYCPREFARHVESLDDCDQFKATQWRLIMLYVGVVCFKEVLKDYVYDHFLLFHISMRILVSSIYNTNRNLVFSEMAIKKFVLLCEDIYGSTFLSYNIHGILHLVEDVLRFGPLDSYSAFPYENNMVYFRRMCRKPHLSLQQIAARRAEQEQCKKRTIEQHNYIKVWKKHEQSPLPYADNNFRMYNQYKFLKTPDMTIGVCVRDNCCILSDLSICCVKNILQYENNYFIVVKKFLQVADFYSINISSSSVGIYKCSELAHDYDIIPLENIKAKCFKMPYWTCLSSNEVMQDKMVKHEFVVAVMQ